VSPALDARRAATWRNGGPARPAADAEAAPPTIASNGAAGPVMSVRALREPAELAEHLEDWEALAAAALEPNPFHEPWMLLPALRAFAAGRDVRVVLVFAEGEGGRAGSPLLCGVFPLARVARYKGLPVPALTLWTHDYAPMGTPLVRATHAEPCLAAFLAWLGGREAGVPLLELATVSGDGPFDRTLSDRLHGEARLSFLDVRASRACFRPRQSADAYLAAACSSVHLKEMRRLRRRLGDLGRLEVDELRPGGDVDRWLREFLDLEAAGWKGRAGTALDCHPASRDFLLAVGTEAFRRGRLHLLALRLEGRAIAMKLNLLAAPGAFALKIAFDEAYARFSPGVLLEVETIRNLHAAGVAWMDSCALPRHPMIDRLWLDRRTIQTLVVSTGRAPGNLVVSALSLFRWANRLRRRM